MGGWLGSLSPALAPLTPGSPQAHLETVANRFVNDLIGGIHTVRFPQPFADVAVGTESARLMQLLLEDFQNRLGDEGLRPWLRGTVNMPSSPLAL